jgi:hypothetical protein
MEAILEQEGLITRASSLNRFIQVRSTFSRAFGCWHRHMSLPFTRGNETYRTCVECGARRQFNLEKWITVGTFYRPENPSHR